MGKISILNIDLVKFLIWIIMKGKIKVMQKRVIKMPDTRNICHPRSIEDGKLFTVYTKIDN